MKTKRSTATVVLALLAVSATAGCGSSGSSSAHTSTHKSAAKAATAHNNAVIQSASSAPDNQAQLSAGQIRQILVQKLGMNGTEDFDLNHKTPPAEGGDCYVKLGAAAVNFEDQTSNILDSPDGKSVVFVQSNTATPLVSCLKAVKTALNW